MPSHPLYLASSEGRIFNIFRLRLVKGGAKPNGRTVRYWLSGPREWAHRMVAEAWLGPCPKGQLVRHLDGNAGNNRVVNLAYGTHAENMQDAIRHGTFRGWDGA